ncbi:hypothetical protein HYH03_014822 [Edaphochlamys debaryana]|uniref:Wax synthase domain-containing protein n=1 Tax=Edaphochlamys debaryana TaxID=47281 RepID=A0A836BRT8_9CHLO|nr:hypothetical protein HYH03_014822 [Edaphochlamys debaryana]|eukprot:KAG2486520.1 hypothetical protein HYH03_014822 [Edaphochlamys debaryana]
MQLLAIHPWPEPPAAPSLLAPRTIVMLLPHWDWHWRLRVCLTVLFLSTVWAHRVVLPRTPGLPRLLAAAPALLALTLAPLFFNPVLEPISVMTVTFMSVRMPLTKLLAACFGRGPLVELPPRLFSTPGSTSEGTAKEGASQAGQRADGAARGAHAVPDRSLVAFLMLAPVVAKPGGGERQAEGGGAEGSMTEAGPDKNQAAGLNLSRTQSSAYVGEGGDRQRLLWGLAGKWLAFAAATGLALAPVGPVAPLALHAALAYGMLAVVGGLMDSMALYATARWGLDLVPPFRDPFRSTSLADFWSRRWNVSQSRVLKGLLYDPIMEGSLLPAWAREGAGRAAAKDAGAEGNSESVGGLEADPMSGGAEGGSEAVNAGCSLGERPKGLRGSEGALDEAAAAGGEPRLLDTDEEPEAPATPVSPPQGSCRDGGVFATRTAATSATPLSSAWSPPHLVRSAARAVSAGVGGAALQVSAFLRRRRVRRAVALLAVFTWSGVEHEIFHFYVQRYFSGSWLTFFSLHGLLLVAESAMLRRGRDRSNSGGSASGSGSTAAPLAATKSSSAPPSSSKRKADGSPEGAVAPATRAPAPAKPCIIEHPPAYLAPRESVDRERFRTLRPWAAWLLTLCVLEASAARWFFHVLLEPGVVARTAGSLRAGVPEGLSSGWTW